MCLCAAKWRPLADFARITGYSDRSHRVVSRFGKFARNAFGICLPAGIETFRGIGEKLSIELTVNPRNQFRCDIGLRADDLFDGLAFGIQ